jgi:N-sulfoglucosamine sulfohydrolase
MTATWDDCSDTAHWRNRPTPETPFLATFTTMINHEQYLEPINEYGTHPDAITDPADVRVPAYLPDTPLIREPDRDVVQRPSPRRHLRRGAARRT